MTTLQGRKMEVYRARSEQLPKRGFMGNFDHYVYGTFDHFAFGNKVHVLAPEPLTEGTVHVSLFLL